MIGFGCGITALVVACLWTHYVDCRIMSRFEKETRDLIDRKNQITDSHDRHWNFKIGSVIVVLVILSICTLGVLYELHRGQANTVPVWLNSRNWGPPILCGLFASVYALKAHLAA